MSIITAVEALHSVCESKRGRAVSSATPKPSQPNFKFITQRDEYRSMTQSKSEDQSYVDLKNGILYETLKQIRLGNDTDPEAPNLLPVWICTIQPKNSKTLISLLKQNYDDDFRIKHLKRLTKVGDHIKAIICSYELENERDEISNSLKSLQYDNLEVIEVPRDQANTRETTLKWSTIWPLTWKGNPNHQFLNSVKFDIEQERHMVSELLSQLEHANNRNASVTIMAKEVNRKLTIQTVAVNKDECHPSDHSVMRAIDSVAKNEIDNRTDGNHGRGYLCTDMIVYTTHEPCVMCSMALVHSRIVRCTYLKSVSPGGGMESSYYLGDLDGLNWKFPIWRWLGESELSRLDNAVDNIRLEY
ncbi:Tad3 protein [Candida orthopsilosis Co 90-125]|uniref:Tad3 protein n=1 Tax=Candida orthopsilosis (strain 90-125) TaxID=1136231 RepID=H8WWU7_CANO9|nr:Tad3 protein [Candida orthopsilosis Co 90-125]CCG21087.1 Tad3 protein [Candida orthopsilosis Co 90-125]